jgi:hypothetical protein
VPVIADSDNPSNNQSFFQRLVISMFGESRIALHLFQAMVFRCATYFRQSQSLWSSQIRTGFGDATRAASDMT